MRVDDFLTSLEAIYKHPQEFAQERSVYLELIPKLIDALEDTYDIVRPLAAGSTATVWEVKDKTLGVSRALKLTRPRIGKLREIITILRAEPKQLATLNHNNIIKVYGSSAIRLEIKGEEYSLPYFLMEYFKDVKDLDDFILENLDKLSADEIVNYFRDVLLGIAYLHDNQIIHCDIKPGNLLVAGGRALVADLGYSKNLPRPEEDQYKLTQARYTPQYAHPDLQDEMKESADSNANVAELNRGELRTAFDLYAFGRSMQEILQRLRAAERGDPAKGFGRRSVLSAYQWRYLNFIAKRLLDGVVAPVDESASVDDLASSLIPGLTDGVMEELKYESADDAVESLEKLLHLYDLEGFIPELNPNLSSYIQIPDGRVPVTDRVRAIINHPMFNHLIQTTQLGFVSLVYPGAAHNRFEHVLGTFVRCCDYVRALWYDEYNCLFQMIMSKEDLEAMLLAALLHDVGQYPMAHDLAEAGQEFRHEALTENAFYAVFGAADTLAGTIESHWGVKDPASVLAILGVGSSAPRTFRQRILHSIISGPLDCDKLDYLIRDSIHLGVSFGSAIDRERLLRNVTIAYNSTLEHDTGPDGRDIPRHQLEVAEVGVRERALAVAGSLWQARRDMFATVYWQHTVRALKAMLGFVARGILIRLDDDQSKSETFWSEFYAFAFNPTLDFSYLEQTFDLAAEGDMDPALESIGHSHETANTASSGSKLAMSDDALLCFLSKFATDDERQMLRAIRKRELYQRVKVISLAGEKKTYESVYSRYKTHYEDNNLREIENCRSAWEQAIIDRVQDAVGASSVDETQPRDIEGMETARPLILIDVPAKSASRERKPEKFWYLPEDQTGVHFRELSALPRFRSESLELEQADFDKHVGKIRILAHPRYRDLIVRSVPAHAWHDILLT